MGYSRKNPTRGGRREERLRAWNSRGIEKVERGNSRGQLKRRGLSCGDQEKIMCNFHGSWFLALEFPSGVTQFCGVKLSCPESPRVKFKT